MKTGLTVALTALFIISTCAAVAVASDESDAAVNEYKIEGYLCEDSTNGVVALTYQQISIESKEETVTKVTDGYGKFSVKIKVSDEDNNTLFIYVNKTGYAVKTYPDCISALSEHGTTCKLDLTKLVLGTDGETYTISSIPNSGIIFAQDKISANIKVTGTSEKPLENASVAIFDNSGVKVSSGTTDKDGIYKIDTIIVGTYTITVKHSGCYDYSENNVPIDRNTSSAIPITLEQKEIPTTMGLTTYHIMMGVGVAVGLALVLVSYILCKRNWANVDSSED